ncbi:MAG: hypothetical protein ACPL3P_01695 [Anaerolineales bacterium]
MNSKRNIVLLGFTFAIIFTFIHPFSASADAGPKPSMTFEFIIPKDHSDLTIISATLFECEQPDCQDALALREVGPQGFHCKASTCQALAYGFKPYHQLEITFSDGIIRKSNVFTKNSFFAKYKVILENDSLKVMPQFSFDPFSWRTYIVLCSCLCVGLIILILIGIWLIRRRKK